MSCRYPHLSIDLRRFTSASSASHNQHHITYSSVRIPHIINTPRTAQHTTVPATVLPQPSQTDQSPLPSPTPPKHPGPLPDHTGRGTPPSAPEWAVARRCASNRLVARGRDAVPSWGCGRCGAGDESLAAAEVWCLIWSFCRPILVCLSCILLYCDGAGY